MISILIPVYNFNIVELISEISYQAEKSGHHFEILCYDDASDEGFKKQNRSIASLKNIRYVELYSNIGRSKIRNKLAADALYESLLFIDGDTKIVSSEFLLKYLKFCDKKAVVTGGICYEKYPPKEKEKFFRWFYGCKREAIPAISRQKFPYQSFMTSNFLIPKSVFLSVKFNEEIMGYGHEDTLFGYALFKNKIPIVHIENPLYHIGIEKTDVFIKKTEEGLKNLLFIYHKNLVGKEIKLLKYYKKLNKFWIRPLIKILYKFFKKFILSNLNSKNPKLILFDLYKLGYLISLK